jgi:cytochrome b6-f complex iron-sulfur subunit
MSESQPIATPKKVSRRELLSYAWLISLVAAAGAGLRASLRFAKPQPRAGEFGGVIDMGPVTELPPPGSPPIHQPTGRFWLVSRDDGVLALHKACTHLDCLCNWDEQTREFVCPCHGSRFAEDGACLVGPATRALDRFVVQVAAPTGAIIAETDPFSGEVVLPAGARPEAPTDGVQTAEAEEAETTDEDPGYVILVNTGRKIPDRESVVS